MRRQTLGVTFFALFCGLVFLSTGAHAQSNGTSLIVKPQPKKVAPKAWSLPLSFEIGSTLHKEGSYERQIQESLSIAPSYRLSDTWKLGASASLSKDDSLSGGGNTTFDNTSVSLSTSRPLTPVIKWQSSFGGVLPTNQELREETTFQGAVRASTGVLFDALFLGSSVNYKATVTRNFHGYNMSADGGFNIRDSLGQTLSYDIPLTSTVSFSTLFSYSMARTYLDDLRTKFSFGADFSWSPLKNFSVAVGTSNDGNALKPNGRDSNIEFFDDNTSVIKLGLTYIF